MINRYYPATRRELNQLAENHRANQQPSPELDLPPTDFAQVLLWLDDVAAPGAYPTDEQIQAARALPPTTTLAEVLKSLGADLAEYGR